LIRRKKDWRFASAAKEGKKGGFAPALEGGDAEPDEEAPREKGRPRKGGDSSRERGGGLVAVYLVGGKKEGRDFHRKLKKKGRAVLTTFQQKKRKGSPTFPDNSPTGHEKGEKKREGKRRSGKEREGGKIFGGEKPAPLMP